MFYFLMFLLLTDFAFVDCNFENIHSTFATHRNADVQKKAAESVLIRVLGSDKAEFFNLSINFDIPNDGFSILKTQNDAKVLVSGPSGMAVVWGVNYYLKNFCNCHISWDGDQLDIPVDLPNVNVTFHEVDKLRYYQNVCTSSYSFVWWDWNRWEREIDWMALNGINLALAFTAQEAIWQRVYDGLDLKYNDFTGPAFLAWNRMGNLRNFSYGLSSNWHEQQTSLQHKILKRMRDLGITPVLPAFCGIVPKSFKQAYPLAKLVQMPGWSRFSDDECCPYLLDPNDALFSLVGSVFLREYISEFGTNHIYNCDTFNENMPASSDTSYLSNISKAIYKEMTYIDPDAIWMVQGWMFIEPFWDRSRAEAFLTGVPLGKMLVLDLQSDLTPQYERLDSYFGQPFIWCMLHNFGGQLGLYGHLSRINAEVLKGRDFENSTMVGIGITPEGIDQNYVMYDFVLESPFRREEINLTEWISQYARRRYGKFHESLDQAWLLLKDTVYNFRPESSFRVSVNGAKPSALLKGEHISKNILTKRPSLQMNEIVWYNRSKIFDVFLEFLKASEEEKIKSSELFQHDFVDITRQTIQTAISGLYFKLLQEYALEDVLNFQKTATVFSDLLKELDIILMTGKKFLLGTWLEAAKKAGGDEVEKSHYEFNARNQITLWGLKGEIRDYAAKQWAGLIADYYKPRWDIFLQALNQSLVENTSCNLPAVHKKIFTTVEKPFGTDRKLYPTTPQGDTVLTIQGFHEKWNEALYEIFKNFPDNKIEVTSI